jgi:hypothetical protein
MNTSSIKLRDVVCDSHGRTGLVCSKEPVPPQDWINDQLNVDGIVKLGITDWWGVMPFDGGYCLSPGLLLKYLREATYDDFLAAADSANAPSRELLVKIFPDYVNRLLAERKAGNI